MTIKNLPWQTIPASGPFLRPSLAAAYLGIGVSTYYEMAKSGELPPFVKLSDKSRASGVPKNWLDSVVAARVAGNLNAK